MSTEYELFKGTNFSDLMRDIYHNSKKKARQIDLLIKNLELVKLAAIVQRIVSATTKDDDNEYGLTEEERSRLMAEAEAEIEKIKTEPEEPNERKVRDRPSNTDLVADPIQED